MFNSALFLIGSFLIGLLLYPVVIQWARRKAIGLDEPDAVRKNHKGAIPRLGGIPILLVMLIATVVILTLYPEVRNEWQPILVCSILIFILGFIDDLRPLPAKVKFLGQILIALAAYSMGLEIDRMTYPGGNFTTTLGAWSMPITIFWLIAVPNIINLIDGFDGLAGGLGVFLSVTLGVVAFATERLPAAWFCFSLVGVLLAFLMFNFPPAKIFLGDGGAYLIGFCIAALSLTSSNKGSVAAVLFVTVVALGLPILDTLFAMIRRGVRGFPMFHPDDDHIHHRLQRLGFSKRRILLTVYGICVILSLVGLSIFWSQGRTLPIAIGIVFLLALLATHYLRYYTTWDDLQKLFFTSHDRRKMVHYALLQANLMELEVERCETAEEFEALLIAAIRRVGFSNAATEVNDHTICEVSIGHTEYTPLILQAAVIGEFTESHWRRIGQCFSPAYRKAQEKWGDWKQKNTLC